MEKNKEWKVFLIKKVKEELDLLEAEKEWECLFIDMLIKNKKKELEYIGKYG